MIQRVVRLGRRIQAKRKLGETATAQRELDITLKIVKVGDILLLDAIQLVQQPGVLPGHIEGKEMVYIGQHGRAQRAVKAVQVGERLGGQPEAAAVFAQLGQHALVVDAAKD